MFTQLLVFSYIIGVIFAYQWTGPIDLLKVIWLVFFPQQVVLLGFFLGMLAVYLAASYHQQKQLTPELWQVPQEIDIRVGAVSTSAAYLYHYQVEDLSHKQNVRLSHYHAQQVLSPGQCYRVWVSLKPIRALGNSTTLQRAKQTWVKREFTQGHILKGKPLEEITCKANFWKLGTLKSTISRSLNLSQTSPTAKAILKALVIGERGGLTPSHWEIFEKTGTGHLMAISGLHIGLVYLFSVFVLKILLRPCVFIFLHSNMMIWARVGGLFCAGVYVLLSGMGVSSLRAWGMLLLWTVLMLRRKERSALQVLWMVVAGILILDPLAGLSAGLWLSAGAVFALIWIGKMGWQTQWKLGVLMLPISSVLMNTSLISSLVNALAIPYVSFLIVPGAFISVVMDLLYLPGSQTIMQLVGQLIDYLWLGLTRASEYTWMIHWSILTWRDALILLGFVVCLLLPWRFVGVIPFCLLFGSLTWAKPILPEPDTVFLHVIDAGQGTALLVQVGDKNLLYDVGSEIVADELIHQRIKNLDVLIVSHKDKDHRAGLADLLTKLKVERFYVGETLSESNESIPCLLGESWTWEEVRFEFIAPLRTGLKGNNASCVLKISLGDQSILLTGDIEKKVEKELLAHSLFDLKSTILIAPHHGSKTSSTVEFIEAVSPEIVIYPTGFLNAYHHPHPSVVQRYSSAGIKQYNTAQEGALSVKLSKQGIEEIRCFRQEHPYWWNMKEEGLCLGY